MDLGESFNNNALLSGATTLNIITFGIMALCKRTHSTTTHITTQVASNKLSLLLKIQILNTQTFKLLTKIMKTESFYQSY
jgi:hypothetical protein